MEFIPVCYCPECCQSKEDAARSIGATLGGDRPSRENGSVGGEMVRRTFESFGRTR